MHPLIEQHRAEIRALAERRGITDVRVFGSMARGDANEASDVDLLVTLPPGKSGLALGGLLVDVQDLLGRRVDVLTEPALHPMLRLRVLLEAIPLYVPEGDAVLLTHIEECIERIRKYTGANRATFESSTMVQDAVVRNLQTLAESTQRLSR